MAVNTLARLLERSSSFINDEEARKDVNRLVKACRDHDVLILYELIGSKDIICNPKSINLNIQVAKQFQNRELEMPRQQFTHGGGAASSRSGLIGSETHLSDCPVLTPT